MESLKGKKIINTSFQKLQKNHSVFYVFSTNMGVDEDLFPAQVFMITTKKKKKKAFLFSPPCGTFFQRDGKHGREKSPRARFQLTSVPSADNFRQSPFFRKWGRESKQS